MNDWWSALATTTRTQMQTAISGWIQSGAPLSNLTKQLTPLFGRARANVIAATETTRMYADGNTIGYSAAGVTTLEWRTSRDERVCQICLPLHGDKFAIGTERPPAHVSCRCSIVPVTQQGKALDKRVGPGPDYHAPSIGDALRKATDPTERARLITQWTADTFKGRGYTVSWNGVVKMEPRLGANATAEWNGLIKISKGTADRLTFTNTFYGDASFNKSTQTLYHEMVHLVNPKRSPSAYWRPAGQILEEGLTDAYARVVFEDFARAMWGVGPEVEINMMTAFEAGSAYRGNVRAVEYMARVAAGGDRTQAVGFINKWKKATGEGDALNVMLEDVASAMGKGRTAAARYEVNKLWEKGLRGQRVKLGQQTVLQYDPVPVQASFEKAFGITYPEIALTGS